MPLCRLAFSRGPETIAPSLNMADGAWANTSSISPNVSAWTKSDVISQAMHVVSILRHCSLASNSAVFTPGFLANMLRTSLKTAISCLTLQTWLMCLLRQNNRACPLHHSGTCRCVTTNTSHHSIEDCTCGNLHRLLKLSGWSALGSASPLAHR